MRILHLCLTYHPAIGGADLFVRRLAEGQAARGHEVEVHTSDLLEHVRFLRLDDSVSREETRAGVRIVRHRARHLPGHIYPILPSLPRVLSRAKADLIHAHSSGYFPADFALLARWLGRRTPLLLSPYGARAGYWPSLRKAMELWNLPDRILALSPFEAGVIETLGADPSRISILPGGVDFDRFASAAPRTDLAGETILYLGRLARGKGLDLLVPAFERIYAARPHARLVLAGPDYGAKDETLHALAAADIGDRARILPAATDDELPSLYRAARVFVLPSRYEAFGLVLLEAMAAGVPIVATRIGSIPDLVTHEENGLLVPPEDPKALADAIGRVLSDAPLAARLVATGRAKARAMTWDATLDRWEEIAGAASIASR